MKKLLFYTFFLILFLKFGFTRSEKLDMHEVTAMKEIWEKLGLVGKKKWDFDKDPCSSENWQFFVVCNCSFESNTTCRVTQLYVFRSYYLGNLLAKCESGNMKSYS
ncbi:hypothetical protein HanXRQr2_Chr17g0825411 [Helianthus annuus]|uniref:Leucine-rich repeat domain, L domain-like protein n=1 Tax=Helianthus annuus TaxID=4232 RepID=A0A9K3DKZ3_HELAN|nr:hypothetical protein HanXRQr2_Chr17g0825411 [Helianthus annuus]KAJ0449161.1 hypothetical protein HanHA89_Chr17g0725291 [Helianthus annuus]KAJ0637818.1 hypothetical protein HanOQP8_Chr17g0678251 [Helianthus annuus]